MNKINNKFYLIGLMLVGMTCSSVNASGMMSKLYRVVLQKFTQKSAQTTVPLWRNIGDTAFERLFVRGCFASTALLCGVIGALLPNESYRELVGLERSAAIKLMNEKRDEDRKDVSCSYANERADYLLKIEKRYESKIRNAEKIEQDMQYVGGAIGALAGWKLATRFPRVGLACGTPGILLTAVVMLPSVVETGFETAGAVRLYFAEKLSYLRAKRELSQKKPEDRKSQE